MHGVIRRVIQHNVPSLDPGMGCEWLHANAEDKVRIGVVKGQVLRHRQRPPEAFVLCGYEPPRSQHAGDAVQRGSVTKGFHPALGGSLAGSTISKDLVHRAQAELGDRLNLTAGRRHEIGQSRLWQVVLAEIVQGDRGQRTWRIEAVALCFDQ